MRFNGRGVNDTQLLTSLVAVDGNTAGFIKDSEGFRVLASSGVAVPLTSSTSEITLATVAIPAGVLGPNGILKITAIYSCNNNANAKTPRIRLGGIGGTILADPALAGALSVRIDRELANRNGQASQITSASAVSNTFGAGNNAVVTATINMANAQDLVFTGQLGVGTDTITLEFYKVELRYGA